MPRAKKKSRKDLSRKEAFKAASFGGYININLTAEDREMFEIWREKEEPNLVSKLGTVLTSGVDIKIYDDPKEGTVVCQMLMITMPDWKIWTVSSFHGDVESVLMLSLYKHFILLDEDWNNHIAGIGEKPFYG